MDPSFQCSAITSAFHAISRMLYVVNVRAVNSMGLNQPKALISGWSLIEAEINCCPGWFNQTVDSSSNQWVTVDFWSIVDSSSNQLLVCLIQSHSWFNQQSSRSGWSEIDNRLTVDSSRYQLLYSSTWLIQPAGQLQSMKKSHSVCAIIPNQPITRDLNIHWICIYVAKNKPACTILKALSCLMCQKLPAQKYLVKITKTDLYRDVS
jgi:hypothetical protein